ncbi:MAG: S41 family peptidase [Defluviitaleaceae bacterium]|nr:S41 family peptidase [Defluviitaleaceae bacterium]
MRRYSRIGIACAALLVLLASAIYAKVDYTAANPYSPDEFRQVRQTFRDDAANAEARPVSDNTIYLHLPNISPYVRRFVMDNRDNIARFDRLILDLRGNYGGQLADAYRIADMFLADGDIIGHESGRLPFLNREITAHGSRDFEFDSIIILQNSFTASAAESLILALTANLDNVTLVGETTFGKGTAQIILPLRDGYSVRTTVMTLRGPNGESIDALGIEADIRYTGVTMLDFALALAP